MTRVEKRSSHPYAKFVLSEVAPALEKILSETTEVDEAIANLVHRICTLMQDAETAERHRTEERFMEGR